MQGDTTAFVRFSSPDQAAAALGRADEGKLHVCGCAAAVKMLQGEEEKQFFKKVLTLNLIWQSKSCFAGISHIDHKPCTVSLYAGNIKACGCQQNAACPDVCKVSLDSSSTRC